LVVISGLIVYRHRSNISNLMAGREKRIGQKEDLPAART